MTFDGKSYLSGKAEAVANGTQVEEDCLIWREHQKPLVNAQFRFTDGVALLFF